MTPTLPDLFDCPQLRCRLTRRACVARQDVRTMHGGQERRPQSHAMCDPAACELGRKNRELVEQEQRDAAGIPLELLDQADELDALDLVDPTPTSPKPTREDPNEPEEEVNVKTRCKCGKEIRAVGGVKAAQCFACRTGSAAKVKAAPKVDVAKRVIIEDDGARRALEAGPVEFASHAPAFPDLRLFSNEQLAQHLAQVRSEAQRRLAGLEALRRTLEPAA